MQGGNVGFNLNETLNETCGQKSKIRICIAIDKRHCNTFRSQHLLT